MKLFRITILGAAVFGLLGSPLFARPAAERDPVRPVRKAAAKRATAISAPAASYSIEIPVVARIQGTAFFRTAIDLSNNTNQAVTATYQLSYSCFSSTCSPQGGFYSTQQQTVSLPGLGNFHQDDIVEFLNSQNLLQPGAVQGTFGTLLVTFDNVVPFGTQATGSEVSALGRTYNRIVESDPSRGTVGFAYNGSLFFESASQTLVATIRDTKAAPTIAGLLRSNLGVHNTDINNTQNNVSVLLEFFDTATGQRVGNQITLSNIVPGELRQVSDVWTTAQIPNTVTSAIAFADVLNPTATTPTIEGYVTIIDGQSTQDAAFFEMRCADTDGCGN